MLCDFNVPLDGDNNVFVVEACGPAEEVEGQQAALIDSLETLKVNRGWW
ncbi:MAG: hypothetical protein AAF911_10555 [Planctomycetota bacterium]